MDFYQHQDSARRNTALLVLLLVLAVAALIAVTVVFATLFVHYFQLGTGVHVQAYESGQSVWQLWLSRISLELLAGVAAVVIIVVVAAGQLKAMQLRRGGEAVAAALDGQLLNRDLARADQAQLLNVVEEMAIASGMPVPAVYLFNEPSINAFAAGYRPTDAVIGITQGALDALNREQLQGVIAHEFSHILHGDMRLNMRLISVLSGITVIGSVGNLLLRSTRFGYRRGRNDKRGGTFAFGLGLVVIGFAGTFFGKLIMAATSRQREFLADASAVQYTRNPNGIAGALKAIQDNAYGSQWQHANAEEFSHLFFGQGSMGFMSRMFATHPPLSERIARITPQLLNDKPKAATETVSNDNTTQADVSPFNALSAGLVGPAALSAAQTAIAQVPTPLMVQTQNIFSARAFIYGILICPMKQQEQNTALEHLAQKSHPAVFKRLAEVLQTAKQLDRNKQWVLLLESLPTLKLLSREQQTIFIANTKYLIQHDEKVTLFEWCIFELAKQTCSPINDSLVKLLAPISLKQEISHLLSFVAHSNWVDLGQDEDHFRSLCVDFPYVQLIDKDTINFRLLSSSVRRLRYLHPLQKPKLLKAVWQLMHGDGAITDNEKMLLKTLSLCLDCPWPENMT